MGSVTSCHTYQSRLGSVSFNHHEFIINAYFIHDLLPHFVSSAISSPKFWGGGGMVTNGGEVFSWEADFLKKGVDFLKKGGDFLGIFVLIFY